MAIILDGSDTVGDLGDALAAKAALADVGLRFVTSQSFSAVSSVSVNNCFTSAYDDYYVSLHLTAASASSQMFLRLRASSTDATAANYEMVILTVAQSTSSVVTSTGLTSFELGDILNTSASRFAIDWDIRKPAVAIATQAQGRQMRVNPGSVASNVFTALTHTAATAYDGFTFYPGSGTITGTVRVYGYKNS